jgi:hypothetical protein
VSFFWSMLEDRRTVGHPFASAKYFFLKWRQKHCLYLLIKKKRIAQLIYGKPGENQYNKAPQSTHKTRKTHTHEDNPTNSPKHTTTPLTLAHSNGAFDESTSTVGNGHHQDRRTTQTKRTSRGHKDHPSSHGRHPFAPERPLLPLAGPRGNTHLAFALDWCPC